MRRVRYIIPRHNIRTFINPHIRSFRNWKMKPIKSERLNTWISLKTLNSIFKSAKGYEMASFKDVAYVKRNVPRLNDIYVYQIIDNIVNTLVILKTEQRTKMKRWQQKRKMHLLRATCFCRRHYLLHSCNLLFLSFPYSSTNSIFVEWQF